MSEQKSCSLSSLVDTLNDDTAAVSERKDAYGFLATRIRDATEVERCLMLSELSIPMLESAICKDVVSLNLALGHAALQTLGVCLHMSAIGERFSPKNVITVLCKTINETNDKTTCTRALWCLAKQQLPRAAVQDQLSEILQAVENGQCKKNFQSLTVEFEALCAIARLLELVPDEMEPHAARWGKLVYPLLLHDAPKIRLQALVAMEMGMEAIVKHREDLIAILVSDLKSLLVSQMSKLMAAKVEIHVLKVWQLYVQILGKTIHHGNLINTLLPIVEQGFKNSLPEVKVAAYQAWRALIENFALNKDILTDQKRVKLLMQVFKINNAKYENVAVEKLNVWWHFVCLLHEGASVYFDQVVVPLLQFAFYGQVTSSGTTPGKTPSRGPVLSKLAGFKSPAATLSGTLSSSPHTYTVVQHQGSEILGCVLGKGVNTADNPKPLFAVESPNGDIVTGVAFFTKHALSIVGAVRLCLITLGDQIEDSLLHHIWFCTVAHIKNMLDHAPKRDSVDVLQAFLTCYKELVDEQCLAPSKLLKLLEAVLCLPQNVLCSPSYSVGASPTVMQGNACQFLLRSLFNHRILETCSANSLFFTVFEKLIKFEFAHESSALSSAQSILEIVEGAAPSMDSREAFYKVWTIIANPLLQVIIKTNEVNQGSNMEYDFTCILKALTLPIAHIIGSDLDQNEQTALVKLWNKLYTTFGRVAALVATAPTNTSCKDFCSKAIDLCVTEKLGDEVFVANLTQMMITVLEAVDFSSLGDKNNFAFGMSVSPVTFTRRKSSSLQNLSHFVTLTEKVLHHLVTEETKENAFETLKKPKSVAPTTSLQNIAQALSTLFTHLPTSSMISEFVARISEPLGKLFEGLAKKNVKGATPAVVQKAERVWQDAATALQQRYTGVYDSDFLHHVAPLLTATFLHPRQKIKSQTMMLWTGTFAHGPSLTYPESLKPVLAKVKEKGAIMLPGWELSEIVAVGETPDISMMSQAESQAPLPNIVGITSPHKTHGTFLNKIVPSNLEASPLKPSKSPLKPFPAKSPKPPEKSKKKLSLNINDMSENDFVVIKASPKKKHILTSHQKEVLKEKSTIPALYSVLDASQDVSLMSKFNAESQMSQMSQSNSNTPTPTPITEIMPFPFFKASKKTDLDNIQMDSLTDPQPPRDSTLLKDFQPNGQMTSAKKTTNRKQKSVQFASDSGEKENLKDGPRAPGSAATPKGVSRAKDSSESIVIQDSESSQKNSNSLVEVRDSEERMDTDHSEPAPKAASAKAQVTVSEVANVNAHDKTTAKVAEISGSQNAQADDFLSPNSQFLQSNANTLPSSKLPDVQESSAASPRRSVRRSAKPRSVSLDKDVAIEPAKDESNQTSSSVKRGRGRPKRRSSLLDGIGEDTQTDGVLQKNSTKPVLQVLAEDTQQMSPPDLNVDNRRNPGNQGNTWVDETPSKEDEKLPAPQTGSCTKNLFKDGKLQPAEPDKQPKPVSLVPYSETQHESEVTPSQAFSPDLIPSSQPCMDCLKQEPITPTKFPALNPSMLTMSPVIHIQRLTQEDLNMTCSPKHNKYTRLREISQNNDSTHADSGKSVGPRRRRSARQVKEERLDTAIEGVRTLNSTSSVESSFHDSATSEKLQAEATITDIVQETQCDDTLMEVCSAAQDSAGSQNVSHSLSGQRRKTIETGSSLPKLSDAASTVQAVEGLECITEVDKTNVFIVEINKTDIKDPFDDTTQDCEVDLTDTQETQCEDAAPEQTPGLEKNSIGQVKQDMCCLVHSPNEPMDCDSKDPGSLLETPKTRHCKPAHWSAGVENGESNRLVSKDLGDSDCDAQTKVTRRRSLRMLPSSMETEPSDSREQSEQSQEEPPMITEPDLQDNMQLMSEDLFTEKNVDNIHEVGHENVTEDTGALESSTNTRQTGESSPQKKRPCQMSNDHDVSSEKGLSNNHNDHKLSHESDDDNVPLLSLSVRSVEDPEEVNKMASSQESEGFQTIDSHSSNHLNTLCLEKSVNFTSSDDEPLSQFKSSTPAKSHEAVTRGSSKKKLSTRKASPGTKLRNKLSIDMHSPIGEHSKALRSKGNKSISRARTLNRSIDTAKLLSDKRRRLKAKRTRITRDDSQIGSQEAEDSLCMEQNGVQTDSAKKADPVDPDLTQDYVPPLAQVNKPTAKDTEARLMDDTDVEVMKSLAPQQKMEENIKPRFVSPLRSPPRKGKPFNLPDTPPSHSKHTLLSRASLILQRAKMVKPALPTAIQRGRGPMAAVPTTDTTMLPGILKSPIRNSPPKHGIQAVKVTKGSPPTGTFRPINLPRIYSPSASPSAGILRKRKLSGDVPSDSPSPPSKQRRVCFNETIETREIPSAKKKQAVKAGSRLVGRGSPKPVNRCLDMPQNQTALPPSPLIGKGTSRVVNNQEKFITSAIPKARTLDMKDLPVSSKQVSDSELSPTQNTIQYTAESQLDAVNPICPELVDCDLSVDTVLPQLTTSVWSVGLGQLFRSMNISTVGKLASLTEQEVHNLPIKSPKVETMCLALQSVLIQKEMKPNDEKELEDENPLPPRKSIESLEDALAKISPNPHAPGESSVNGLLEPRDLLDEIRRLDDDRKSTPPCSPSKSATFVRSDISLLDNMKEMEKNFTMDNISSLPTNQLLQIYTNLNQATTQMNSVMASLVVALKNKCPTSPSNSQT